MPRLTPTADMKGGNMSTNHTSVQSYTLSKVFIPDGQFISPVMCLRYNLIVRRISFVPYSECVLKYLLYTMFISSIFYYCLMRMNVLFFFVWFFLLWRFKLVLSAGSLPFHHLIACMVSQREQLNNHIHWIKTMCATHVYVPQIS